MEFSKLTFSFKELTYLGAAAVAYFAQLYTLSNKIETHKHASDLRHQDFEFRLKIVEQALGSLVNIPKFAIIPDKPERKEYAE